MTSEVQQQTSRSFSEDLLPLSIVLALTLLTTSALEAADWVPGLWVVARAAVAGVFTGWLVSRLTRVPPWIKHPIAVALSLVWIHSQVALLIIVRRPDANRYIELWHRVLGWTEAIIRAIPVEDPLLFVAILALSMWLIAHTGAWTLARARWVWPSIVPGATVIVINMIYSARDLRSFLFLYLLLSIVLMGIVHAQNLDARWQALGVRVSHAVAKRLVVWATALGLVLLAISWTVPSRALEFDPGALWNALTSPWNTVQDRVGRILTSAVKGARSEYSSFGPTFDIGGPVRLKDQPVMIVRSEKPAYWAVAVYDQYTGKGWRSSLLSEETDPAQPAPQLLLPSGTNIPVDTANRVTVTETVTILEPRSSYLPAATVPVSYDTNVLLQVNWVTTTYSVDLASPENVPDQPEIRTLMRLLQLWRQRAVNEQWVRERAIVQNGTITDLDTFFASLPWSRSSLSISGRSIRTAWTALTQRGVSLAIAMEDGIPRRLVASGPFPVYDDVRAASLASGSVGPNFTYTVVSSVPNVSPDKLRASSGDYPEPIRQRYLQLPEDLPQRVRDLAQNVTKGADNNYDKAKAIEQFLRQYTYNENVPFVPRDRDAADYFLFDIKQGYCTSYASAMIVMLRSIGIPARMVTGYTTGAFDEARNAYVVLDSNAHAWPEVYFPGFGWIPFEPTSSRPPILLDEPSGSEIGSSDDAGTSGTALASGRRLIPDEGVRDSEALPGNPLPFVGVAATPSAAIYLLPLVAAMAAMATGWALWKRLFRGLSGTAAAYHKAITLARMAGTGWSQGTTALERAYIISRVLPEATHPLVSLAEAYSAELYAPRKPKISAQLLHAYWRKVRIKLIALIITRPFRAISTTVLRLTSRAGS